ncbi:MAG: hypothetical protein OHK0053_33980 [Microscillaceae bacterium]
MHKNITFYLCVTGFLYLWHSSSSAQIRADFASNLQEAKKLQKSSPEASFRFALAAEKQLSTAIPNLEQAELFTILGNLYGLHRERPDKAAQYHRKAFQIYFASYEQQRLLREDLYLFFLNHVSPVYTLISSENYRQKRRDKMAIRAYQALYTELSQFFLEKDLKKKPEPPAIALHSQPGFSASSRTAEKITQQNIRQNLASLTASQKELLKRYIAQLEQKLSEAGIDFETIQIRFGVAQSRLENELEKLHFTIVAKDSLLHQQKMLARQRVKLLEKQKAMQATLHELDRLRLNRNILLLSFFLVIMSSLAIGGGYHFRKINAERKRVEALNLKLALANEELDQFAHRVSHDLRAPINSALSLIYVARDETSPNQIHDYLNLMERSLHRQDEFIRDILDYARSSKAPVQIKEINLVEVVEEVQQQQKFVAKEKNIRLQHQISTEVGVIWTDITHLRVILNNLLANAIRYADLGKANPYVEMRARKELGQVAIEVRDNGLGIAAEHQSRIFDMFYRAHEKAQGSGLGLHLVKQSVEKLGGHIQVKSEVGEGTSFQVFLPYPPPKKPEPVQRPVQGQMILA